MEMTNLKAEIASMSTEEIRNRLSLITSNGFPDLIEAFVIVYMRRELKARDDMKEKQDEN